MRVNYEPSKLALSSQELEGAFDRGPRGMAPHGFQVPVSVGTRQWSYEVVEASRDEKGDLKSILLTCTSGSVKIFMVVMRNHGELTPHARRLVFGPREPIPPTHVIVAELLAGYDEA